MDLIGLPEHSKIFFPSITITLENLSILTGYELYSEEFNLLTNKQHTILMYFVVCE